MALTLNKDHVILIDRHLSGKYNSYKHTFIQRKNISREHQDMKGRIVWITIIIGKFTAIFLTTDKIIQLEHQQEHIKPEQVCGLSTPYYPALITLAWQGIFQIYRSQQTGQKGNHNKNPLTRAKLLVKMAKSYFCWYYVLFSIYSPVIKRSSEAGRKLCVYGLLELHSESLASLE